MAQTKFKLNLEDEDVVTHAHTQNTKSKKIFEEEPQRNSLSKATFSLSTGIDLSIHLLKLFEILTPTQKKQLIEHAKKDDKTASCIIKEALITQDIIEAD